MLIALYGINNIGKTYHAKRIVHRLRSLGKKALYLKYPVYAQKPSGPLINSVLRSNKAQPMSEEELQLLFVLNRYQFQPELKKKLEHNVIVVAEDYIGTGIAWGMAKTSGRAKMRRQLEDMNKYLVQPDVAILLEGRRKASASEMTHIHEQHAELMLRCQKILKRLARLYKWKIVRVDEDKDVTAERLWKAMF